MFLTYSNVFLFWKNIFKIIQKFDYIFQFILNIFMTILKFFENINENIWKRLLQTWFKYPIKLLKVFNLF